ncbi:hypothetical protein [uncultured Williamsia sp.]|uniref:hypothetical protein n=1 Tax=uncultured Williamsia sp. TaxID=259311 RepID=UPI00262F8A7C|nr:hypothetical protein [uncultured Williamsia sp.]
MTNHKAIAEHLALGSSPAQVATALDAPLSDVERCVADLQTILRATSLDEVRDRLVQMGYGAAPLAPWSAAAFRSPRQSQSVVPAA